MNHNHTSDRSRPASRPAPLVAAAALIALALLVVGVRQLTVQLRDDGPVTAPAAATAEPGAPAVGGPPAATGGNPGGRRPLAAAAAVVGRITMGEVIIDETSVHTSQPDKVTIEPGPPAGARVADLPGQEPDAGGGSAPGTGEDDGAAGSGPGSVGGSADATADRPIDGTVDLTLGVRVETVGHLATVFVGIGGGMDGLTALRIDFGDGGVLRLDDGQVARLAISGRMNVVHEYEPTLTPQPQTVLVTATDGGGQVHTRSLRFSTRAEFRLTYSPLTVTALDDCDLVGKGDFELTWRLDSRPARHSTFKLGKNETYVEQGFRIGITGVHYGEPLEYFSVRIEEHDPGPGGFTPVGFREFPGGGPVAELANHHYEVTMHADDVENAGPAGSSLHWDCDVRMTFTAYLTMIDSPDRR